jgi:hypothetical protein
MIMYGLDQSPKRMAGGFVAAQAVTPLSYTFATQEQQKKWEWFIDNGFIKLPLIDVAYSSNSLFPIWSPPMQSTFGTTMFDFTFAISSMQAQAKLSSYLPGTRLPE